MHSSRVSFNSFIELEELEDGESSRGMETKKPFSFNSDFLSVGLEALRTSASAVGGKETIDASVVPFLLSLGAHNFTKQRPKGFRDIWLLFHKVAALASTSKRAPAVDVMAFVYISVRAGLSCEPCRAHFLDAFEAGAYGAGSVLQDDDSQGQVKRLNLWLWKVHNAVNVFRAISPPHEPLDFFGGELRWPLPSQCSVCWRRKPAGDEAKGKLINGSMDRDIGRSKLPKSCFELVKKAILQKRTWSESSRLEIFMLSSSDSPVTPKDTDVDEIMGEGHLNLDNVYKFLLEEYQ